MALQGPIPVQFSHVFPHGGVRGWGSGAVRDFDASKDGRFVQANRRKRRPPDADSLG